MKIKETKFIEILLYIHVLASYCYKFYDAISNRSFFYVSLFYYPHLNKVTFKVTIIIINKQYREEEKIKLKSF